MTALPLPLLAHSAAQVRAMDAAAINDHKIPGALLMKRAGRVCFNAMLNTFGQPAAVTVFCGGGNNGGDGYVIAGLAKQANIAVQIYTLADPSGLKGEAKRAYEYAIQEGVAIEPWSAGTVIPDGVVVDALLGTGFAGELRPEYLAAIEAINQSGHPVLAVDIPSGLHADTGAVEQLAVMAQLTCTFIGVKLGLLTGEGPTHTGELVFDDLEVPTEVLNSEAIAERLSLASLLEQVPARAKSAHKGHFGHALILGGSLGYGGAAIMAAEACARMGAGLTSLATAPENTTAAIVRCPEVMAMPVRTGVEAQPLVEKASVIAVGPGLGQEPWSEQLLFAAISSNKPLVIDADGLNLLAAGIGSELLQPEASAANTDRTLVLTPHPGEAARLLQTSTHSIQADRPAAAVAIAQKYRAIVVLKGAGTLIAEPGGSVTVCTAGNPGMASGGMGDVLTGIIAGLLAQTIKPLLAVQLAVCLHAEAADALAAEAGQRGLLATDLIGRARALLNEASRGC